MPIYEYICKKCQKRFEVIQKTSEEPQKTCSECSGALEKLISRSAFQLKGSGWYKTDFAGKAKASTSESACEKPGCESKTPCSSSASSSEAKAS